MAGVGGIPEAEIVRRAAERGLTLDPARAAALRPPLESLLARLAQLGAGLPPDTAPPPPLPPGGER